MNNPNRRNRGSYPLDRNSSARVAEVGTYGIEGALRFWGDHLEPGLVRITWSQALLVEGSVRYRWMREVSGGPGRLPKAWREWYAMADDILASPKCTRNMRERVRAYMAHTLAGEAMS